MGDEISENASSRDRDLSFTATDPTTGRGCRVVGATRDIAYPRSAASVIRISLSATGANRHPTDDSRVLHDSYANRAHKLAWTCMCMPFGGLR